MQNPTGVRVMFVDRYATNTVAQAAARLHSHMLSAAARCDGSARRPPVTALITVTQRFEPPDPDPHPRTYMRLQPRATHH